MVVPCIFLLIMLISLYRFMESGANPERARRRDMQKAFFYQNTAILRQAIGKPSREGEESA